MTCRHFLCGQERRLKWFRGFYESLRRGGTVLAPMAPPARGLVRADVATTAATGSAAAPSPPRVRPGAPARRRLRHRVAADDEEDERGPAPMQREDNVCSGGGDVGGGGDRDGEAEGGGEADAGEQETQSPTTPVFSPARSTIGPRTVSSGELMSTKRCAWPHGSRMGKGSGRGGRLPVPTSSAAAVPRTGCAGDPRRRRRWCRRRRR